MTFEDRDNRVVRRLRESKIRNNPPAPASEEEAAVVEARLKDFKPKPYVHPFDDTIYEDEDDDYPWAREGWDPEAAAKPDYVVPPRVIAGEPSIAPGPVDEVEARDLGARPAKADPTWFEPSPAEKARITTLVTASWTAQDMATVMEMPLPQFLWAFHDTLHSAALAMKAKLTTTIFADALASKGAARERVANFLGVYKDKPVPAATSTVKKSSVTSATLNADQSAIRKKPRRVRFGGPPPKPGADGRIEIGMVLGDTAMQTKLDEEEQIKAQAHFLLIDLRASRGQDRDGNAI